MNAVKSFWLIAMGVLVCGALAGCGGGGGGGDGGSGPPPEGNWAGSMADEHGVWSGMVKFKLSAGTVSSLRAQVVEVDLYPATVVNAYDGGTCALDDGGSFRAVVGPFDATIPPWSPLEQAHEVSLSLSFKGQFSGSTASGTVAISGSEVSTWTWSAQPVSESLVLPGFGDRFVSVQVQPGNDWGFFYY